MTMEMDPLAGWLSLISGAQSERIKATRDASLAVAQGNCAGGDVGALESTNVRLNRRCDASRCSNLCCDGKPRLYS